MDKPAPLNLDDCWHSAEWHHKAFQRAYCLESTPARGPFLQVRDKLASGFSVLVYLPGNCMPSAAQFIRQGNSTDWQEYGLHPDQGGIADVWKSASGMVQRLKACLGGQGGSWPRAIYHNLDLLSDDHNDLYHDTDALTAFFALQEATRSGVVLGLADREVGELPQRIQRLFPEHVRLGPIELAAFEYLVPESLVRRLAPPQTTLSEAAVWLIASRLRFADPIRAMLLMQDASNRLGNTSNPREALALTLQALWGSVRSLEHRDARALFDPASSSDGGFERDTFMALDRDVVAPFVDLRNPGTLLDRAASPSSGDPGSLPADGVEKILKLLPNGLILHGPAGTGKTHLVRWLARKADLPLRIASAREVRQSGWGEAERIVHRLFQEARRAAPCILVFDEADDLFLDRDQAGGSVAEAARGVVNAALQELDGLEGRPNGVLVVMTTNRFDSLDRAVKSRLGIRLLIPFPTGRLQIREIVCNQAADFGLKLKSQQIDLLKDRFYWPVSGPLPNNQPFDTEPARRVVNEGLFAPRDIRDAMRRLYPARGQFSKGTDGRSVYEVGEADVQRLLQAFDYEGLPPDLRPRP